ncbi:hypothetical protein [Rubinisphaera sp. JC750]|uniref:hypothetical protein n=1 Tax=Rubinisphaera sp. JC750 TaxID=2898658 RepID=UPI001F39ED4D|nr:hypothetical protein [Rubinisphaera sp. JC750]
MTPDEFQHQIEQRDELVQALTRQLEQAAEQLDRMQRSGGVAGRPQAAGLPADFTRQQSQISEDVAYLVQQWENTQVAGAMGRIEMQLEELRDLVHQARIPADGPFLGQTAANSDNAAEDGRESDQSEADLSRNLDLLASLKEAMNADTDPIPEFELEDQSGPPSSDGNWEAEEETGVSADLPSLPDPPAPIDLNLAEMEEIRDAIDQRDRYIQTVVDHSRSLQQLASLNSPVDWQELNNAPDELVARLQQLEQQLVEQLRTSEISMSLERARLSRESTQLDAARIQLEKKMKKYGLSLPQTNAPESKSASGSGDGETSPRAEKWLNMLRIKES